MARGDVPPSITLWRDPLFYITLLLTLFAVAPFLLPGYHWGANDARHHVYFLHQFNRMIEAGVWWPRWSPDFTFGYGYPFFNIYGPLSHFVATFFLRVFGFSHTGAVEATFVLSIVGSVATMFLFVRSWLGREAAAISALVYTYAPYHLLNLYVRANLAESMAFVWLPLVLWAIRGCVLVGPYHSATTTALPEAQRQSKSASGMGRTGRTFWWALALGTSLAALVLTSQLVTLLFAPLAALYFLVLLTTAGLPDGRLDLMMPLPVRIWAWVRGAVPTVLGGLMGLGLSCIFWLPMIFEYGEVNNEQWFDGRYDATGQFVYPFQLFSSFWGYGVSVVGPDDGIGFQLGAVALVLAALGLLLTWRARPMLRAEIGAFAGMGLLCTLFALTWGAPLWRLPVVGGVLGAAQFPWRWLVVPTVCLSVLSGLVVGRRATSGELRAVGLPTLALMTVVILGSYSLLRVEVVEPAEGPVGLPALMRFQSSADEMTGVTAGVDFVPRWSPIASYYLAQEAANPDEPVAPVQNKLWDTDAQMEYNREKGHAASTVAHTPVSDEVFYFSAVDDWSIIFNTFYYPGWRAYLLDGEGGAIVRELEIELAPAVPEEGIPSGRIAIPVEQGEGFVLLRFEDTPPRTTGRLVSQGTLTILLLTALLFAVQGNSRRSSEE